MPDENKTPETPETPVVETPVVETPAVETPAVEMPAVETPEPVVAPTAKSLADAISEGVASAPKRGKKPEGEADAKVEGADGEAEGEGDKEGADKEAAEKEGDKEKDKKELDHVNDPIDERLSERTKERVRALIDGVKQRDEALTVQGNLIGSIQSTGASPEQFAETISFLRDVNSNDPAALDRAYKSLQGGMRALAIRMGKPVPEVDLLAEHPDLAEMVKYGQITKEIAQETALHRSRTKMNSDAQARTTAATQAATDAAKVRNDAITDLNTLGEQLAKTDPDYKAKYDQIVGPLKEAFADIPPQLWGNAFKKAYAAVKITKAVAPPVVTAPAVKKNVPIRPIAPAGQGTAQPKTMLDAVSSALENM